jgi:hypothetical protein
MLPFQQSNPKHNQEQTITLFIVDAI